MRRYALALALVALGCMLGAGMIQAGRLMERREHNAPTAPPAPAAAPDATGTAVRSGQLEPRPTNAPPAAVTAPPIQYSDPPQLVERARAAYASALRAALEADAYDPDELVLLRLVAVAAGDRALVERFSSAHLKDGSDPFARLIDPNAEPPALVSSASPGILGLYQRMLGSVGQPDDVALRLVGELAALPDEHGYVLCHQVLALSWLEATGRTLSDPLLTRRSELLQRIEQEQAQDTRASDLFAERASTLLLYGSPTRPEVQRWARVLIDAQQPDGTWPAEPHSITFDGETRVSDADPMHSAAHALFVLRRFIDTSAIER